MITVLGATGNVGGKLVTELLNLGQKVRVVGRDPGKLKGLYPTADVKAGDINDLAFLTSALQGSEAAFVMIPPEYAAPSFGEVYRRASESIAQSIKESGVPYIVSLSSVGAQLSEGTGPIKYLKPHEERLNKIEGVAILHLRPAYFFENLLANVPLIQAQSIMGSHIDGATKFPMIATADIAQYAARRLVAKDFKNKSSQELLGPRDMSLNEVASIVSEVVGKPVKYVTFDAASTIGALKGFGFSSDTANLFIEMSQALNTGLIKTRRDGASTTATDLARWANIFKA